MKTPSRYPLRFFRWFCNPEFVEDIEGDLLERFEKRTQLNQPANRLLWLDVLKLFRPAIIKPARSGQTLNQMDLLQHHIIIAFRIFKRFKSTFFINAVGLSTGLAAVLLIFLWVNDELSFDNFHENGDRIYQVMQNIPLSGGALQTDTGTPGLLARTFLEELPEVEYASSVLDPSWFESRYGLIDTEEKRIRAVAQYVEPDYFNIFSWKVIAGDKQTALADKNNVLLSEALAAKVFGSAEKAMGSTIQWAQEDYNGSFRVTGIFQAPPKNSTTQFDIVFHYDFIFDQRKDIFTNWGNSGVDTYITLKEGVDPKAFNEKIKYFQKTKYDQIEKGQWSNSIPTQFVHSYQDKYLYNKFENGELIGGRILYVRLLIVLSIFIFGIACINFINLSTARAGKRVKEIGVKKALGAHKKTLTSQFLVEAFLMAIISALIAVIISGLALPFFNQITGKELEFPFNVPFLLVVISVIIFTGGLAGLYPAVYLARLKTALVAKGRNPIFGAKESFGRKTLVVTQFTISIVLIISVMVIQQQISLIYTKNLGYNRDNVLIFKTEGMGDNIKPFVTEARALTGVLGATTFGHALTGDVGGTGAIVWPGREPDQKLHFANLEVDHNWFELLNVEMAAGRPYQEEFGDEHDKIIFNESAIKAMGLEDPVGKTIKLWGQTRQIIGVAKDFHFESLYEEVRPCFIQQYDGLSSMLIKIEAGKEKETIGKIESLYKNLTSGLPFEFRFLDNDYDQLYFAESRVAALSKYFAFIAILISCLGLFGLATFSVEKRTKEIGIRKVLGASAAQIWHIISQDFLSLIMVSCLVAIPCAYYYLNEWLAAFAYRVTISWWIILGGGLGALLIGLLTVSSKSIHAALRNPVESLRYE